MLISEFSDAVKYEFSKCKTKEDIENVSKKMISIVKGHEIVTSSNLEMQVDWNNQPTTKIPI